MLIAAALAELLAGLPEADRLHRLRARERPVSETWSKYLLELARSLARSHLTSEILGRSSRAAIKDRGE